MVAPPINPPTTTTPAESAPDPLGICLRKWREKRGLSISELARRCGWPINKATISNLETGKLFSTNDSNILRFAKVLGIRPKLLFARVGPDQLSPGDKLDDLLEKYADLPEVERERLAQACLDTFDSLYRRQLERYAEESGLRPDGPELASTGPVLIATSR